MWKATYEGRPHFFTSRGQVEGTMLLTKAERIALTLPSDHAVTVKGASARLRMPPSTVRRHLALLQAEGLLGETKVGRSKRYWIKDPGTAKRIFKAKLTPARKR